MLNDIAENVKPSLAAFVALPLKKPLDDGVMFIGAVTSVVERQRIYRACWFLPTVAGHDRRHDKWAIRLAEVAEIIPQRESDRRSSESGMEIGGDGDLEADATLLVGEIHDPPGIPVGVNNSEV